MAPFTSTPTQFFISSSLTIQNHLILLFTVIIVTFSDGTTAQDHSSFFFLGFFSIYLRQCGNGHGRSNWGRAVTAARSRRVGSRGLDPELIEKLPTLVYSDVKVHKIGKGALECAVCPSEFEDDQMLRLLPICDHVFHTECIDQWLESHTTCPVCRTNLAAVVDSPDYCRPLGRLLSVGRQVPQTVLSSRTVSSCCGTTLLTFIPVVPCGHCRPTGC